MTNLRDRLSGISGVPVTAYDSYGEIDHATTVEVYARCARAGIHNLVAAGNTGEFYALTPDEIQQVYDAAIEGADGQAPVTAAVGRSLREAVAMSRAAAKMGAQAVMSHQPVDPFAAPRAQIDYFRKLADESEIPVVAYVRADGFSVEDMRLLGGHANIAAVKFATHDVQLLARAIAESDPNGALWVCGLAESWAPAFASVGATGFTSGLVNVAPHFSLEVLAALQAGDYAAARRVMTRIEPFERMRTLFRNGANVTVVKESVEMLGLKVGPVRAPGLERLSDAHRSELRAILTGWGLTLTA